VALFALAGLALAGYALVGFAVAGFTLAGFDLAGFALAGFALDVCLAAQRVHVSDFWNMLVHFLIRTRARTHIHTSTFTLPGPIGWFLGSGAWLPFARMSFAAYLIHFLQLQVYFFGKHEQSRLHVGQLFHDYVSNLV
jgi:hypothetical protein